MTPTPSLASRPAPAAIRIACTPADLEAIARLRYDVYVTEMGRAQACADHVAGTLHEPLDAHGFVVGAFLPDGRAVGTVRLSPSTAPGIPYGEIYGFEVRESAFPGQMCVASKLIVSPEYRGTLLSIEVLRVGAIEFLHRGYRFCFLDANDHLVALYTRLGFVSQGRAEHPLYGSVTVMDWDLHDVEHARAVRSLLLPELVAFQQLTAVAA